MKYSIIIPCKNEPVKMVQELVNNLHNILKTIEHEIIIIDQVKPLIQLKNCKVLKQKSKGLGKAVLEGVEHSSGDYIVTLDADHSHRPLDVYVLMQIAKLDYDIILGSKQLGVNNDKFLRRKLSDVSSLTARKMLSLDVSDPLTGLSCIKKTVYEELKLKPSSFKFVAEILRKGRKEGYKVLEQPIIFEKRVDGKSKFNFKEFLITGFFLLKLKVFN